MLWPARTDRDWHQMRERSGPGKGEVVWRAPHQQGLVNMLRHPAYAGIYAYGRSRTGPSRRLPGREHTGRVRGLDAGQWLVRIEGALPAYIQRGAVRAEPGPAGRQPGPRRRGRGVPQRPGAAGRTGDLRDLRAPPAAEL